MISTKLFVKLSMLQFDMRHIIMCDNMKHNILKCETYQHIKGDSN